MAANDAVIERSRTVPIPDTIQSVPGYPDKLSLFKMPASKFWQVRCWIAGRTHRRSTRTTSLRQAQRVARQFYEQLLVEHYRPTPLWGLDGTAVQTVALGSAQITLPRDQIRTTSGARFHSPIRPGVTFGILAAQMYANEEARVERGEFARGSLQVLRNRLDAHILPTFAQLAVAQVDYNALLKFSQMLSKAFSTTTVSQYLIAVRKVLSHAARTGVLEAVPEFPKVKVITRPRYAFTPSEYWQILRRARGLKGQPHPETTRMLRSNYKLRHGDTHMAPDLAWAVGFMVNAFIRPSDLRTLKHKHVEIVRNGSMQYLRLTLPETKRHASPIVTLRPAVRIYQQIVAHQSAQGRAGPEDYLFLPHLRDRHYALSVLGVLFNWVLDEAGLKRNPHGAPRSLYSLRHSAITFRLLYGSGIDVLTLARNARTSVEVINKHYASTVTGEQNIAMLQSRRTARR